MRTGREGSQTALALMLASYARGWHSFQHRAAARWEQRGMGLRPVIGGYPRPSPTLAEAVSGSLGPLFSRIRPKSPFLAFRVGVG